MHWFATTRNCRCVAAVAGIANERRLMSVTVGRGRSPGNASAALAYALVKLALLLQSAPAAALHDQSSNERSPVKRFCACGSSVLAATAGWGSALTLTRRMVCAAVPASFTVTVLPATGAVRPAQSVPSV